MLFHLKVAALRALVCHVPSMYPKLFAVLAEMLGGVGVGIASISTVLIKPGLARALESDEFEEVFDEAAIGIELEDVSAVGTAATGAPLDYMMYCCL